MVTYQTFTIWKEIWSSWSISFLQVHKVIPGTLAARDGRVRRGDRVLSINGRSTKGVAHRDAIAVLKAPRPEVVLVLSRSRSATPTPSGEGERDAAEAAANSPGYVNAVTRPPRILESPLDSKSLVQSGELTKNIFFL